MSLSRHEYVDLTLSSDEGDSDVAALPLRPESGPSSLPAGEISHLTSELARAAPFSSSEERTLIDISSPEALALSKRRQRGIYFCDDLRKIQDSPHYSASHVRNLFLAMIEEAEMCKASLSIENKVDNEPCPMADSVYTMFYITDEKASLKFSDRLTVESHCNCDEDQCDPETCECRQLHETLAPAPWAWEEEMPIMFAYDGDGLLEEEVLRFDDTPIWECNRLCKCSDRCCNRVVGKGRQVPLTIFKTQNKGWGVRTDEALPRGRFICTYSGELLDEVEAAKRSVFYQERLFTSYLLDIDPFYLKHHAFTVPFLEAHPERRPALEKDDENVDKDALAKEAEAWCEKHNLRGLWTVDATFFGSISRYFNHSCEPNMKIWPVYTNERDLRRPYWSFFTIRKVRKGEELTFRYWSVAEDDEKEMVKVEGGNELRKMKCYCGSSKCTGNVWRR